MMGINRDYSNGIMGMNGNVLVINKDILSEKISGPHCDLTGMMVTKGNHPKIALFQISELL